MRQLIIDGTFAVVCLAIAGAAFGVAYHIHISEGDLPDAFTTVDPAFVFWGMIAGGSAMAFIAMMALIFNRNKVKHSPLRKTRPKTAGEVRRDNIRKNSYHK